ncbi:MAG: hypothetical protein EBS09_11755 [Flavobacteriia bacterium]|jgi:hypothetical protein|nr:hypothetical protein [Flavobacteriia bacterium]
MKNKVNQYNDFVIDKLTNSITNRISGDSFTTEVSLLSQLNIKLITKKNGWLFNWKKEFSATEREVYKLTILHNEQIIQGLSSISIKSDHIFLNLIESAPFNRGENKLYEGVPGNLVAFACKLSFQRGYDGFVAFHAKTQLIKHYEKTLNAIHHGNQLMIIDTNAAIELVNKYFKS